MKLADLFIKLGLNKTDYDKGLNDAKKSTSSFGNAVNKVGAAVASIFAVGAITNFVSQIINVRKNFEKYEAVLGNTLGSQQAARQEMKMLQEIASKTPFSLDELTASYVKMVNYGLKPTKDEIIKLGDLASSTGKGFNQLVEAVADATTGQYERLKEFGIKASQAGDKVTFTFKEQKTTVDNNATAIKAYLTSLGDLQGVSGSMAVISETLGGKLSNLGDSWDSLLNTLGRGTSGIMVTVINWLNRFISMLDMAYMSIEDIKRSVMDKAQVDAFNNALDEIGTIEKSLAENGMKSADAHKRAIELYVQSVNDAIKNINPYKHGGQEQIDALKSERDSVLAHFKKIDEQNKKTTESGKKYKDLIQEIADKERLLKDLPKGSVAYYEAEISLLKEKQKLITDPQLLEQSKTEIAIKEDYLKQLTGELKLLEQIKLKNKDIAEMFTKGIRTDQQKSPYEQKNGLIVTPKMQADIDDSEARAELENSAAELGKSYTDKLNEALTSGISEIITTAASLFGEMAALNDWDWKDFGNKILDSIGKFMQTFGALMISMGVAMLKIDLGMASWNPALLIGGGVALVAAGAAVSALAGKGLKGSTTATSSASGYNNFNSSTAASTLNGNVVFELQGTTLRGVLNNTDRKNNLIR